MNLSSNRILENGQYLAYLTDIATAEREREFCHHDMEHVTEVARIVRLLYERSGAGDETELTLLTCAAYLHDIGRVQQKLPHEEASALLAEGILRDAGASVEDIAVITALIRMHRGQDMGQDTLTSKDRIAWLGGLLKEADRLSRPCYACDALKDCYWPQEKRNTERFQ